MQAEDSAFAFWNARYESGDLPWETGIVPPEIVELLASPRIQRGWALDLGCGSGVSTCFLARHGFRAVGIDLALVALGRGRREAEDAGVPAYFCAGDVTDLCFLNIRASLAIDVGCFHALCEHQQRAYIRSLACRLVPGAYLLLYAHAPQEDGSPDGPFGVGPRQIAAFAPQFSLVRTEHGSERGRSSTWYLLQRCRA